MEAVYISGGGPESYGMKPGMDVPVTENLNRPPISGVISFASNPSCNKRLIARSKNFWTADISFKALSLI
jgi:hypothetical protein